MRFNTGETTESLKETYNSDGSLRRKCQLRMLDMLAYLDGICREEGIEYQIIYGTVIGAARHQGFIPWDDDADIMLERKDYKRLCQYLKEHPHPQYVLQTCDNDNGCLSPWAILRDTKSEYLQAGNFHNVRKYRGLQVDLFPFERGCNHLIHDLAGRFFCHFVVLQIEKGRMMCAKVWYYLLMDLVFPVLRLFDRMFGNKDYYWSTYGTPWHKKISRRVLFPARPIQYEGLSLMGPNDADGYCREQYGEDYNNLPPIEKRDKHEAEYRIWD